jgi:hypothetical protein
LDAVPEAFFAAGTFAGVDLAEAFDGLLAAGSFCRRRFRRRSRGLLFCRTLGLCGTGRHTQPDCA